MTDRKASPGESILRASLRLIEEHPTGQMARVLHRLYAPYCVKLVGGTHAMPVNRQYKPLGVLPGVVFVNYDDYLETHGIPLADLPQSSVEVLPDIYLYREGLSEPWGGQRYLHPYIARVEEFFGL